MKKLIFVSFIALFVLTGCQNDEEEQTVDLTTEESKQLIDDSGASLSNDIVSLVESDGVNELIDLLNLLDEHDVMYARTSRKAWTKERLEIIKQYFVEGPVTKMGGKSSNSLEDIKGLYIWNPDLGEFDVEASEIFIVQFPTEGSSTNNAEFSITNLEYAEIDQDLPETINAYLKVDDVIIVELDYDVDWSDNGTPKEAHVSLLLAPFRFEIDFVDVFAKSTSLLTSVLINEEVVISVDVDVSYESESKDDPFLIEGFVQYRGLKIDGNVDAREIGVDGNPNDFINLALYSDDAKIGDIIFVLEEDMDGTKDYIAYVEYSDGSTQNLEDVLAPVFEEIEEIFSEFE